MSWWLHNLCLAARFGMQQPKYAQVARHVLAPVMMYLLQVSLAC